MTTATISLFLPDGDSFGLRTARISNWSGVAVAAPRTELAKFLKRRELDNAGVYFLLGFDTEDGDVEAYIGEAEQLRLRIGQHKSKEFWVQVIAFTSNDESLTKAHVRYLERRCVETAKSAGRCKLTNSVETSAKLPESDAADMEVFLERVIQLLPVMGSHILTPVGGIRKKVATRKRLQCKIKGCLAEGNRTPSGFIVYKGSQAVLELRPSSGVRAKQIRKDLINSGAIVKRDKCYEFVRDVEFSSPSRAGVAIKGGATSGLTSWKDVSGRTLKEIDNQA